MAWTTVAKPTGTPYTAVSPQGKEMFDDPNVLYDDSTIFFDGVNTTAWGNILKPTGNTVISILKGMATGLLIPFTYSTQHDISSDSWTKINKPI